MQAGEAAQMIDAPTDDSGGPVRVELTGLAGLTSGRVWLQPVGRRVDHHPPADLTFARLPVCAVTVPDRLYGEHAAVTVTVDAPLSLVVNGTPSANRARAVECVADAGQADCVVSLRAGNVEATLRLPVARARVRSAADPASSGLLLDADAFKQLRFAGPKALQVSARPQTSVCAWLEVPGRAPVVMAGEDGLIDLSALHRERHPLKV